MDKYEDTDQDELDRRNLGRFLEDFAQRFVLHHLRKYTVGILRFGLERGREWFAKTQPLLELGHA